jgi:hypothetical protein
MKQARLTDGYASALLVRAFIAPSLDLEVTQFIATVLPAADLIVDGQRLLDIGSLMMVLDPTNWTAVSGYTVSVSLLEVTRFSGSDAVPSSLSEQQEQGDDLRVVFTVSDSGGRSQTVVVNYTVYPVATVATVGDVTLDLVIDSGVQIIPFIDLFEPMSQSVNWVLPSDVTLSEGPSVATLGAGSLRIGTNGLAEQANMIFTIATDVVIRMTHRYQDDQPDGIQHINGACGGFC